MASIHRLLLESNLLKAGAVSPPFEKELFFNADETISYELEVAAAVTDTDLPGFGSGDADITTIQTFLLHTTGALTLNWNGADISIAADGIFLAYDVSTTTVPHVTNSGSSTVVISVLAGGT